MKKMQREKKKTKKRRVFKATSIIQATTILMVASIVSRILGYIRDMVIYASFGQNRLTDAYYAAFSIPDFLYNILVGGALSSAFIPVFGGYLARGEKKEALIVANTIFNLVLILMSIGIIFGLIFTPQLISLLVPGFEGAAKNLTISLTRIMFLQALFMALSGLTSGILNAQKHFLMPALGSVLYNLVTILIGYLLSLRYGIAGFSIGVVLGSAVYFAVQIPILFRSEFRYVPLLRLNHEGVQKLIRLFLPVLIGLSVSQFNLFVNQYLASGLDAGVVAALRTAQRLMQLPISLFAVSLGMATFPTMTTQAATANLVEFKSTFKRSLRLILFITIPASIGLIVLRVPVVRLLFEMGAFTAEATLVTSTVLFYYALGIFGWGCVQLLNRTFYALENTRIPVFVGVLVTCINIILNFSLVQIMGYRGLALAYSLAGILNFLLLTVLLKYYLKGLDFGNIFSFLTKVLFSSLIMAAGVKLNIGILGNFLDYGLKVNQLLEVGVALITGILIYAFLVLVLRIPEAEFFLKRIRNRRPKRQN